MPNAVGHAPGVDLSRSTRAWQYARLEFCQPLKGRQGRAKEPLPASCRTCRWWPAEPSARVDNHQVPGHETGPSRTPASCMTEALRDEARHHNRSERNAFAETVMKGVKAREEQQTTGTGP